jgi:hypothetical protein
MNLNLVLIILFIVSLLLNVYLYFQLKRYHLNDSAYKAKWQTLMGLHNPINLLLWFILSITVFLGLIGLLSGIL